jgi:S1-C subfamily serine protease
MLLMLLGLTGLVSHLLSHQPKVAVLKPRYPAAQLSPALLERVENFTVLISDEGLGGVGRGTGVVLDKNTILSCAHMIEPDSRMLIYTRPFHDVRTATVKYVDTSKDLALFTVDRPIILRHYATFLSVVEDGTPITVVGNILGSMQWFVSYGIISGHYNDFLLTDALTRGGNSGGPWVNNKGEIVALTDWGLEENGKDLGIAGGVSSVVIYQFLKDSLNPLNILLNLLNGLK